MLIISMNAFNNIPNVFSILNRENTISWVIQDVLYPTS